MREQTDRIEQPVDTSMRLTQNEAVLAVMIEHLEREVGSLRYVLGGVLQQIHGYERCNSDNLDDFAAYSMHTLYRERGSHGGRSTPPPPFPPGWLGRMARTGKSVAQVARSRTEAADRLRRALTA